MKTCITIALCLVAAACYAQRRAARVLPAEAVEAALLECVLARASAARTASTTGDTTWVNAFFEHTAAATNAARLAGGRIAWENYALDRDGQAPTNAPAIIQAARLKILSVQSVTNTPPEQP